MGDSYGKSYSSYEEPTYRHKNYEPTYEVEYHDDDYGYEHKYDHKPSYNSHKYKRSVYGYGGDSYGKSYNSYSSYKPSSYRHKRSVSYDTYGGDHYGKSYSSYKPSSYHKRSVYGYGGKSYGRY